MGEPTSINFDQGDSKAVELTGKIMVIAIIVFFVVVVFVIFLHLYAKWFWWRTAEETTPSRGARRHRRFVFAPGRDPTVAASRRGLDLSALRSLPVVVYRAGEFKDGLECAVCLSELVDGEKARVLPKCSHGFHVECIDMWFQSHSTCPLCRSSVERHDSGDSNSSPEISIEFPNFPTNVLFWGNQSQVSAGNTCLEEEEEEEEGGSSSSLAIEIPDEIPDSSSSSSLALSPSGEGVKSPMTTRLRSLKRLLSRERRVSPCSPSSGEDDEQPSRGQC